MATNPAVSLPRAGAMRAALKKLELFVVSENVLSNDTIEAGAQVLLPAASWGEKDGTVTNSERRISRQRAFLPSARRGAARLVDRQRGGAAFGFWRRRSTTAAPPTCSASTPRLSAFENDGEPRFRYRRARVAFGRRLRRTRSGDVAGARRRSARRTALLRRRRIFYRRQPRPLRRAGAATPRAPSTSQAFPLRLNTGRLRDQWHTMTRTGAKSASVRPFARTIHRDPSGRCEGEQAHRRRFRQSHDATRQRHPESRHHRRPATRLDLCTDPLERRHGGVCTHWRIGRGGERPLFRPARAEDDAGARRTGRVRLSGLCVDAASNRAAGRHVVRARRSRQRRRTFVCDERAAGFLAWLCGSS